MYTDAEYQVLKENYNELCTKYDQLERNCQDLEEKSFRLQDLLSDVEAERDQLKDQIRYDLEYENWKRICRKVALEFRIFSPSWWPFFLDYINILRGRY